MNLTVRKLLLVGLLLGGASIVMTSCTSVISGQATAGASGFPPASHTAAPSAGGASSSGASSSGVPASATSGSNSSDAQILEQSAIQASDLNGSLTRDLIDGGDSVTGQTTLDNCGYTFTSEAHRIVRRQYSYDDASGNSSGLSNELVAYDTEAWATKAMQEWAQSVATCPKGPAMSQVSGVGLLTTTILSNQDDVAALPLADNAVTAEAQVDSSKSTYDSITVLQRQGRFITIIYAATDATPTSQDLSAALQISTVAGSRLQANAR